MPEKDALTRQSSSEHDGIAVTLVPEKEPSVTDLTTELANAKDRHLRSLAEQENIRAQARRDRDEAVQYAAAGFAGDLLSSIDNLERAIASVPEDKRLDATVVGLLTGVEATRRALLDAFAKHGLKRLNPVGEPFNPHRHEASFESAGTRYPPGTVTSVIQPGYMHHERLLRPALVGVSKTPDPPRKAAPATPDETPPP
jgi:molecular chaperone GrpE